MATDPEGFLRTLKSENAAMEAEIAALTGKPSTQTYMGTKEAPTPSSGCVKLLNFGTSKIADEAGKDFGTAWVPAQCSRRTVLGGFFTS